MPKPLRMLPTLMLGCVLLSGCAVSPQVGAVVPTPCQRVQVPESLKTLPVALIVGGVRGCRRKVRRREVAGCNQHDELARQMRCKHRFLFACC